MRELCEEYKRGPCSEVCHCEAYTKGVADERARIAGLADIVANGYETLFLSHKMNLYRSRAEAAAAAFRAFASDLRRTASDDAARMQE